MTYRKIKCPSHLAEHRENTSKTAWMKHSRNKLRPASRFVLGPNELFNTLKIRNIIIRERFKELSQGAHLLSRDAYYRIT